MRAAAAQSGSGAIGVIGPVLAALVLALGIVLLRDALVTAGLLTGKPWLSTAVDGMKGFSPTWWLIPLGVVVALVGLWLVVNALRPRSRKTVPLTSQTGVFLRTRDIARLASSAAQDVDGVLDASSTATRRTVAVSVHAVGESTVRDQVRDAVTNRLSTLASAPRVTVTVHATKEK